MTKKNNNHPYQLTEGEQKLINQIRLLQDQDSKRPMMVTVRYVNGLWQIFKAVPAGQVKDG